MLSTSEHMGKQKIQQMETILSENKPRVLFPLTFVWKLHHMVSRWSQQGVVYR